MEGSLVAYKVFTNGSTLQASEINENLMRQATAVFSNAAARTAAITSPVEGQMTYLEDSNRFAFWNGSEWSSPFGLTQIVNQTIGSAVTSVTLTNVFSSEFDSYKIIVSGGTASTGAVLRFKLGSASTGHSNVFIFSSYIGASTVGNVLTANEASFRFAGFALTNGLYANFDLTGPFLSRPTQFVSQYIDNTNAGTALGAQVDNTSFTSGTLSMESGTMTGGNVAVYGYRKVA
jgi:hypothetical protein